MEVMVAFPAIYHRSFFGQRGLLQSFRCDISSRLILAEVLLFASEEIELFSPDELAYRG